MLAAVRASATPTDRLRHAVELALDDLEKAELLRKRLAPNTRQYVWLLDHDYLCHGVLAAERLANPVLTQAQEGYRAFQETGGSVWRRWWTLLSPWQQIGMLIKRVRGRCRYTELRPYALWSLLRFAPYLLMIFIFSGVVWYWDAYHRPHVAYYANGTDRWDAPEGVGQITADEAQHRAFTRKFIRCGRYGPVEQVEFVNGYGICTQKFTLSSFLNGSLALMNQSIPSLVTTGGHGACRVTLEYDTKGRLIREKTWGHNDQLLFVFLYDPETLVGFYWTPDGRPYTPVPNSGAAHFRFTRSTTGPDAGRDQEIHYEDAKGNLQPDAEGSVGLRAVFDACGLPVRITFLGADMAPRLGKSLGAASLTVKHDH